MYLENKKHREDCEREKPDPDFKDRDAQPAQQLFLTKQHFTC